MHQWPTGICGPCTCILVKHGFVCVPLSPAEERQTLHSSLLPISHSFDLKEVVRYAGASAQASTQLRMLRNTTSKGTGPASSRSQPLSFFLSTTIVTAMSKLLPCAHDGCWDVRQHITQNLEYSPFIGVLNGVQHKCPTFANEWSWLSKNRAAYQLHCHQH